MDEKLHKDTDETLRDFIFGHLLEFVTSKRATKQSVTNYMSREKRRLETSLDMSTLIPTSFAHAVDLIQTELMPIERLDVCVNDCIIYRDGSLGNFATETTCPECGEPRYNEGTHVGRRPCFYMPIGPRLVRAFGCATVSALLQDHMTPSPIWSRSIHNATKWDAWYAEEGEFGGDRRGISLAVNTDGVAPFGMGSKYSVWPIVLNVLNLPSTFRTRPAAMHLSCIVPSAHTTSSNKRYQWSLQPYLQLLVDELEQLQGKLCFDAYHQQEFTMNVKAQLFIMDYPAFAKVSLLQEECRCVYLSPGASFPIMFVLYLS